MHNPAEPHIEIINTSTEKHLENFSEKIRAEHQSNRWRCLYTNHDPELIRDPCCKSIIIQFLKTTFDDADTTEVFWSTNGHLFIFFQGPVRPVVKSYEQFLDAISMDGKKIPYRFFWEIQDFWGYFDEILAETFRKDEKAEKNSERIIMIDNSLDKELVQQRVRRYKPLLMIVEDDATTRHFLQSAMEQYCDIVVAWNVQQAIALYEVMLPNIAFLDIELPDGNGQQLTNYFCAYDPDSFIVIVSGSISKESIETCLKDGARGFVAKPIQEAKLLKFIDVYNSERRQKSA